MTIMYTPERLSDHTARLRELSACTDAVRWLSLKASLGTSNDEAVTEYFLQRYPGSPFALQRKAAVPPVGIGSGGDALLPPSTDPIIALVQKQTLQQRMGLVKVPFNVPVPVQSALGAYKWVLQGMPKPVSRITWTSVVNPAGKIIGIVPLSRELVKLVAGAEAVMAAALTGGAVQFSDKQFLDPAVALVPNGSPASITNGVVPITSSATTLAGKVRALIGALFTGRPQTQRPALIATPAVVSELAASDQNLTVTGGTFGGVPVFPSPEAGALVIALDCAGVIYSDDGGEIDPSEEATVQLDDAPDNPSTELTLYTSFWQTNLVGFRVERFTWWQKLEANVVQTLAVS